MIFVVVWQQIKKKGSLRAGGAGLQPAVFLDVFGVFFEIAVSLFVKSGRPDPVAGDSVDAHHIHCLSSRTVVADGEITADVTSIRPHQLKRIASKNTI